MSASSRNVLPRVGDEVHWLEIAPHPTRTPFYGRVVEVCNGCGDVLIRWYHGYEERVPLSRLGSARPQAWFSLTGRKASH